MGHLASVAAQAFSVTPCLRCCPSNGGKVSRKRLGQQRRQGVTEKASAATEARCHGKGLGSNGGKVSRKMLGQQRRQGVTEKAWAATEARCHGKCLASNGGKVS